MQNKISLPTLDLQSVHAADLKTSDMSLIVRQSWCTKATVHSPLLQGVPSSRRACAAMAVEMQGLVADERRPTKEKRRWVKPSLPPRPGPPKIPRAASVITLDPCTTLPKTTPLPQTLADRIGMPTVAVGFDIASWHGNSPLPMCCWLGCGVSWSVSHGNLRARKHTAGQSRLARKAILGSSVGTR